MLVIVSDLHLTDGTSGDTIHDDAFRIFRKHLSDMAYAASWRKDRTYKPITQLHVVLLGDILDIIRSGQWTADGAGLRPWSDWRRPEFAKKVGNITKAILDRNALSLDILRSLSRQEGALTLPLMGPAAERSWTPEALPGPRVRVQARLYYQIGNHDWFFHLPGEDFDKIRESVVDRMGLDNQAKEPFPHDPLESEALAAVYQEHGVLARHGDVFDPFNCERHRDASSLGDAIVVELLNRLAQAVRERMPDLPAACLEGLKEIDNVRPLLMAPVWLDGLLRRTEASADQVAGVKRVWNELADSFLAMDFVRRRTRLGSFGQWHLRLLLKFSGLASVPFIGRAARWFRERLWKGEGSFSGKALTERAFREGAARFIVYGHTHEHEVVPLDISGRDGQGLSQVYVNTGTWRKVQELAVRKPEDAKFVGRHVMTYAVFYKDDERSGRPFESWSGALG